MFWICLICLECVVFLFLFLFFWFFGLDVLFFSQMDSFSVFLIGVAPVRSKQGVFNDQFFMGISSDGFSSPIEGWDAELPPLMAFTACHYTLYFYIFLWCNIYYIYIYSLAPTKVWYVLIPSLYRCFPFSCSPWIRFHWTFVCERFELGKLIKMGPCLEG